MLNFLCTILEKEIDPPMGARYRPTWQVFEDFFNIIFLCELALNYWGSAYLQFFTSSWNVFDLIVCTMGALSLARFDLPPPWTLLRCFRAFRVFRLFKRIPSLNKIMVSLVKAIPGVTNAFLIIVIVMCIFSIIAVEFFAEFGKDGYYNASVVDANGVTHITAIDATTARGMYYGAEYYGSFMRALFSLFQVLTGESWSEVIARPLVYGTDDNHAPSSNAVIASIFFVVFLLLNSIVLINVVVAVLLEKMVDETPVEDEEDKADEGGDEVAAVSTDEAGDEGTAAKTRRAADGGATDPAAAVVVGQTVAKTDALGSSPSSVMHGDVTAKLNGKAARAGDQKSLERLHSRLDGMDARFDATERLLQQILAQLNDVKTERQLVRRSTPPLPPVTTTPPR